MLIKRNFFGDRGVRVSLLGYRESNGREKPVLLCENLHGTVGIFDPYSGRRAIFVERSYEGNRRDRKYLFVWMDERFVT